MPEFEVRFFQDEDGSVPALDALARLQETNPKVVLKFEARIQDLEENGFRLRRPVADFLRDGIYELRAKVDNVQHRLLYFFAGGKGMAILSHHVTKTRKVPEKEIDLAIKRKMLVDSDLDRYTLIIE